MKLINGNTSKLIESINNPFNKGSVKEIDINIEPGCTWRKPFHARISFINNNTKGEHCIEDDDFEILLKRIESVVNNL